jgi:acyl carrier protein
MPMDETADRIKTYVAHELLFDQGSGTEFTEDTPLLPMIDSLGLVQLVAFLEEEFDIEIEDAEVTADNFRTIGDISRMLGSKAS